MTSFVATSSVSIDAPRERIWRALTDRNDIRKYMFGTEATSEWTEGSSISWRGEWKGKRYEDKGVVLKVIEPRLLAYSHFSPLSGLPDEPENYHVVNIELAGLQPTWVTVTQDGNPTESARKHSEENWSQMLGSLKRYLEAENRISTPHPSVRSL
ncbi:MAG TPA: SRPBCC family protein [Gemmatimonadales bacterium]|nr:SRPBCC family protein [Gemmatimonadales bacterium]